MSIKKYLMTPVLVLFLFLVLGLVISIFTLLPPKAFADYIPDAFVTTWKTDNPGTSNSNQITIPTTGGGYNYTVDWGDGIPDATVYTGNVTHTYVNPGTYTVSILGTFPRIYFAGGNFGNGGDKQKILSVKQWGNIVWTDMSNAFQGASNLVIDAIDVPDLSFVTSLDEMFYEATSFNQNINNWDVSNIVSMYGIFSGTSSFNQPLNSWDVSKVISMEWMFGGSSFNQDISGWDVSSVQSMRLMFDSDSAFNNNNQPLDWGIKLSNVTNMYGMFYGASSFNQDISNWNVSNVTNMSGMFAQANSFNQDISNWNVSNVTDFSDMFWGLPSFDQDLSTWNIISATNMNTMFQSVTLSTVNYDAMLSAWSTLSLKPNTIFYGGNSKYCSSVAAREIITNMPNNWTIFDGGYLCTNGSSSSLSSFTPLTLTQTGNTGSNNVQYQTAGAVIAALPTTVNVTLVNTSVLHVPVTWTNIDHYNASIAGSYTFTATWGTMPAGVNNNNHLASPRVEVVVSSSSSLSSFTSLTLTQTGNVANNNVQYQIAGAVIAVLPTTVTVTLVDTSVVHVPVTWANTDTYNASIAGSYTFTATWGTMPAGANNNNHIVAPTVELVVSRLIIGDSYQGGIVAYILQNGDSGYDPTIQKGLIAAPSDQNTDGVNWGCYGTPIVGADGTALRTGKQNTIDIMAGCATAGIAARLAGDLVLGGYDDWYLPSKDELNKLYLNRVAIGGFATNYYWSSSEDEANYAIAQYFPFFGRGSNNKNSSFNVRAIRPFPESNINNTGTTTPDEEGGVILSGDTNQVVVTDPTQEVVIDITDGTDNPTLDVSTLVNEAGILPEINITSDVADIKIEAGTRITSVDSEWTGVISAPTIISNSQGAIPSGFLVGDKFFEIGSPTSVLFFDKAVKITIHNVTSRIGYKSVGSNVWNIINKRCNSATNHDNISYPNECYYPSGKDTIVWAYHFTEFGEFNAVSSHSNSSGGGRIATPTTSTIPTTITTTATEGCILGNLFNTINGEACIASPTISITPTPLNITRTLKLNMTGDDVKAFQVYLNTHGHPVSITGAGSLGNETTLFGPLTKKAVIAFQKANSLIGDGIVGPLTMAKMK